MGWAQNLTSNQVLRFPIKKIASILFCLLLLSGISLSASKNECFDQFQKLKIKSQAPNVEQCVLNCAIKLPDGLKYFDCGLFCDEFCDKKIKIKQDHYIKNTPLPPLCKEEFNLILENPPKALGINKAKIRALELTKKYFGNNRANDESDAFRHFIWSDLSVKETDGLYANKFTNAHESCITEDVVREMDLQNNQRGITTARKLKEEGKLTEENLVQEALKQIQSGKLIIVKPSGIKIPNP